MELYRAADSGGEAGWSAATDARREIWNAIFYGMRGGVAWRLLPHDFPRGQSVYGYFRLWRIKGIWQQIHDQLRGDVRQAAGRNREPSAAIVDSQSVKTTDRGGVHGYDAGKKVNGRKRHILVDTMGLIWLLHVTAASIQDRDGARLLLAVLNQQMRRLRVIWADSGYAGVLVDWVRSLRRWGKVRLALVQRTAPGRGFQRLPHRWIVEQTFGWFGRWRRLSKDYEYLTETSESAIRVVMIHVMVRRLAPVKPKRRSARKRAF